MSTNQSQTLSALPRTPCSPFVFCEADLKKGRTIKAEQGEGVFRFALRDGRKTRKIEMSDDEAWIVGKIISAMHPHISGSNDPLWHQIQEQRKIILENVKVMAHPLAGANVDRGVRVEIRWKHRKQRG